MLSLLKCLRDSDETKGSLWALTHGWMAGCSAFPGSTHGKMPLGLSDVGLPAEPRCPSPLLPAAETHIVLMRRENLEILWLISIPVCLAIP